MISPYHKQTFYLLGNNMSRRDFENILNCSVRLILEQVFAKENRTEVINTISLMVNRDGTGLRTTQDNYLVMRDFKRSIGFVTDSRGNLSLNLKADDIFSPLIQLVPTNFYVDKVEFYNGTGDDLASIKYYPRDRTFEIRSASLDILIDETLGDSKKEKKSAKMKP